MKFKGTWMLLTALAATFVFANETKTFIWQGPIFASATGGSKSTAFRIASGRIQQKILAYKVKCDTAKGEFESSYANSSCHQIGPHKNSHLWSCRVRGQVACVATVTE